MNVILSRSLPNTRNIPLQTISRRCISDHSASAKLFADAEREEQEDKQSAPKRIPLALREHENWTGDELMEDAVLRMLVDKYKPLRTGTIRTADEKIKAMAPQLVNMPTVEEPAVKSFPLKDQPLLPVIEGHRPWHTTFRAPSHATPSVRHGTFTPRSPSKTGLDEKALKKEREERKRFQVASRLTHARESTLDYRLGLKNARARALPNPVTMKGWAGLAEDRIERARAAGHFTNIKGRGQPLRGHIDEKNPFIGREEFLLNRIVQQNGAAPPWVELQSELDVALRSFREILSQAWIRRATRMLTAENPIELLHRITLQEVIRLRDAEWENRERAYHETALEEVNSLVRKYNGLAPYAVRRPYYLRQVELDRVYEECAERIHSNIMSRMTGRVGPGYSGTKGEDDGAVVDDQPRPWSLGDVIRTWLAKLMNRAS